MGSASTRLEIVERAVKQAGRSAELYGQARLLLNDLLRGCALRKRYRILRKVGTASTLAAGSSTDLLPTDYGAGTEQLLFSTDKTPIPILELADFIQQNGYPGSGYSSARPEFVRVDEEAGVYQFSATADQAYTYIPIYYKLPANLDSGTVNDGSTLWYEDDDAIIAGLIWKIYQYTDDLREQAQFALWNRLDAEYRRGTAPNPNSGSRIRLSPNSFKQRVRRTWW